jgi:phage terminase large subunit GpA-like protein
VTAAVTRLPRQATPEAIDHWRRERDAIVRIAFAPRSTLTLSQWADQNRVLSSDLGSPGQWKTSTVPYMRRIMDAITDPRVREVSVRKPTRIGATQAIVLNTIGYYIDQEPSPVIVAVPTLDDARKFSAQLLQPMLDDTPCLAGRVEAVKSKRRRQTILEKSFAGITLQIIGTKSARAMRMVHGRIILMSEVDAYDASAGVEGDPTKLIVKRAGAYDEPKIVRESTPLILEHSRINPAFLSGSEEYFYVPCPHCKEYQQLEWGDEDTNYGIKWEKRATIEESAETVFYVCKPNGCEIEEPSKFAMTQAGEWKAEHPERKEHLSFHLDSLVSPFDGARWAGQVKELLEAEGKPEAKKVWVNTLRGLPWEEEGIELDESSLTMHVHPYPCECAEGKHDPLGCETRRVPDRAAVITRFVDTQDDRLEVFEWAWGAGEEAWRLELEIIPGDPGILEGAPNSPWSVLAARLGKMWRHEYGAPMTAAVTGIDSGGHHTKEVYAFAKKHLAERVFATKGSSLGEGVPLLGKISRNNSARVALLPIGVFAAKEAILSRFAKISAPGPGYIHLHDGIDAERLKQFAAEKLFTDYKGGRPKRAFRKAERHLRNEELDGLVGAMAMLQALGVARVRHLGAEAQRLREAGEELRKKAETPGAEPPDPANRDAPQSGPRRQTGWMRRMRGQ